MDDEFRHIVNYEVIEQHIINQIVEGEKLPTSTRRRELKAKKFAESLRKRIKKDPGGLTIIEVPSGEKPTWVSSALSVKGVSLKPREKETITGYGQWVDIEFPEPTETATQKGQ